jgi:hypothetical protein
MSKTSKSNLPTISSNVDKDLRIWTDRVRELLEGKGGFIVSRDALIGAGVVSGTPGGGIGPPLDSNPNDPVIIPILVPPKPEYLNAAGGWAYINLEWATPPYYGHDRTLIYRVLGEVALDAPVESELTFVAGINGYGSVWSNNVGTGKTYTYFIRYQNLLGQKGPFSEGAIGVTAIDVEEALNALSGEITTSQLASDLRALTDGLEDNYVVKIQKGGVASGFGLVSKQDTTSGKIESTFAVLANRFALMAPVEFDQTSQPSNSLAKEGDIWRREETDIDEVTTDYYKIRTADNKWIDFDPVPFVVQTTPDKIGDVTIPPGVYIRDAYIMDASIGNAKMGVASIDTANIANAAITRAKVGSLDAGDIITGELKSHNFSNEAGKAGFFLKLGQGFVETAAGDEYIQEDVSFILRSKGLTFPALELNGGEVSISGAVIRDYIQSGTYNDPEKAGWKFDVVKGTFRIKNAAGETILASGGNEGAEDPEGIEDPNFILTIIDDKIKEIERLNKEAKKAADEAKGAADDAKDAADDADDKAGDANTAAGSAQYYVDRLDDRLTKTFSYDSRTREYSFANNYTDFFTSDNDLKDFAFLAKVTPENVSTYIGVGAIQQASIGRAAIGTAQIDDLAVTEALIANAAVQTLQIGKNAVVVGYAKKSARPGGNDNPLGGTLQIVANVTASGSEDGSGTIRIYANDGSGASTETIEVRQSGGSFNAFSFPISACHQSNATNGNVGWVVECTRTSGNMRFGTVTATINVLKR